MGARGRPVVVESVGHALLPEQPRVAEPVLSWLADTDSDAVPQDGGDVPAQAWGSISGEATRSRSAQNSSRSIDGALLKASATASALMNRWRRVGANSATGTPWRVTMYVSPRSNPRRI